MEREFSDSEFHEVAQLEYKRGPSDVLHAACREDHSEIQEDTCWMGRSSHSRSSEGRGGSLVAWTRIGGESRSRRPPRTPFQWLLPRLGCVGREALPERSSERRCCQAH